MEFIQPNTPPHPRLPEIEQAKKDKNKHFFIRFFTANFITLSLLEVLLILAAYGGIIFAGNALLLQKGALSGFLNSDAFEKMVTAMNDSTDKCQRDLQAQTGRSEECQKSLESQAETSGYDKIRMADATNILLALQSYNFDKGNLPQTLAELAQRDYYGGNLNDPELGKGYFYKKIDPENYVLCFYLSTGVWGTNRDQCPAREDYAAGK